MKIDKEESPEDLLKLIDEKLESVNRRIEWVKKMKIDKEQYLFVQDFNGGSMNENQNSGIQCFEPLPWNLDSTVLPSPLPQLSSAAEDFCPYDFENQKSGIQCFEPLPWNLDCSVLPSPLPQLSFAAEDFGGYDFDKDISLQFLQSLPGDGGDWSVSPCPQPQLSNVNQILAEFEEFEASQVPIASIKGYQCSMANLVQVFKLSDSKLSSFLLLLQKLILLVYTFDLLYYLHFIS